MGIEMSLLFRRPVESVSKVMLIVDLRIRQTTSFNVEMRTSLLCAALAYKLDPRRMTERLAKRTAASSPVGRGQTVILFFVSTPCCTV